MENDKNGLMSTYSVLFTVLANKQIQNAIDYYNLQHPGLGKRFKNDLKRQLTSLKTHPFSRAIRYDEFRFAVLDKFPYAAHYTVEGKTVIIHGVLSMRQDPETSWIGKA